MTSEVEQRPMLVKGGSYQQHRQQWVKVRYCILKAWLTITPGGLQQHPTDIHTFPFLNFFYHFQVVSERLFSTPQSSSSSLTGSSDSQGPLQPQEPHHRAHGENKKWIFAKKFEILTFSHCIRSKLYLVVFAEWDGSYTPQKLKIFSRTVQCVLECSWKVLEFVTWKTVLINPVMVHL